MNARIFIGIGTLGIAVCSAAGARSISTDGWSTIGSGNGATVTVDSSNPLPAEGALPPGVVSLVFSPGTAPDNYTISSLNGSGDMYVWGNSEQVIVNSGASGFTIDFNYGGASSCPSETAMLSVNGATYSAANPCARGTEMKGIGANSGNPYDYFQNEFVFGLNKSGNLQLDGSGWGPVAAPEIDPNSAFSGLTLLLGGVAVIVGRRRSPVSIKA